MLEILEIKRTHIFYLFYNVEPHQGNYGYTTPLTQTSNPGEILVWIEPKMLGSTTHPKPLTTRLYPNRSLSLSHTHTHAHTYCKCNIYVMEEIELTCRLSRKEAEGLLEKQ